MAVPAPDYLTYPEVARILRCSEKTVLNRVKAGELQSFCNGRLRLFTKEAIDEYLNRNASATPSGQSNTRNN